MGPLTTDCHPVQNSLLLSRLTREEMELLLCRPHDIKEVGLVVVTWNNASLIRECLDSIGAQTFKNLTTIVVDNGSSDDTVSIVATEYSHVSLMGLDDNSGFAYANNVGLAHLWGRGCDAAVLLNSDARLSPTWIAEIVEFANDHPDAAAIQGHTLNYHDRSITDSRGICLTKSAMATQLGHGEPAELVSGWFEVFGVNAAACLYTRRFLDSQPFQDAFDSDLFMYLEDVDLSIRARCLGWKNYVVLGALAYHMGSASSKGRRLALYYTYRNNAPILYKNLRLRVLAAAIPRVVIGDIGTLVFFMRRRMWSLALNVVWGRLAGLAMLPAFRQKRKTMLADQRYTDVRVLGTCA